MKIQRFSLFMSATLAVSALGLLGQACGANAAKVVTSATGTQSEINACQAEGRDSGEYSTYAACMHEAGLE